MDLPNGQTCLVHLCSRPFTPELRCTLGQETAIRQMIWTDDGWLRTADGDILPKLEVPEPDLPAVPLPSAIAFDDFKLSDEYCQYGEFTGAMAGIFREDRMLHRKYADFDFFEYPAD